MVSSFRKHIGNRRDRDVRRGYAELQRADHLILVEQRLVGLSPSYLIGENASDTSACFRPAASFVMITIDRLSRVEMPLDGRVHLIERQR